MCSTYDIMWREAMMELLDQLEAENPENPALAPKVSTQQQPSTHAHLLWHLVVLHTPARLPDCALPVLTRLQLCS
jgi:hypothetical protein